MPKEKIKKIVRKILPPALRKHLGEVYWRYRLAGPKTGKINFGDLRRREPINPLFGRRRGQGIDRYYIENFLAQFSGDIKGNVLEVADDRYSKQFGGDRIKHLDILHKTADNPRATVIADLTTVENIPFEKYDCVIITQTLQFIYNTSAAIKNLHRALKPGGVVLATFPGISQIVRYDMEKWGDYWRFTSLSAELLFKTFFPEKNVSVQTYGNVLASISFLHGLAVEDIDKKELDYYDKEYQLIVAVRAQK